MISPEKYAKNLIKIAKMQDHPTANYYGCYDAGVVHITQGSTDGNRVIRISRVVVALRPEEGGRYMSIHSVLAVLAEGRGIFDIGNVLTPLLKENEVEPIFISLAFLLVFLEHEEPGGVDKCREDDADNNEVEKADKAKLVESDIVFSLTAEHEDLVGCGLTHF